MSNIEGNLPYFSPEPKDIIILHSFLDIYSKIHTFQKQSGDQFRAQTHFLTVGASVVIKTTMSWPRPECVKTEDQVFTGLTETWVGQFYLLILSYYWYMSKYSPISANIKLFGFTEHDAEKDAWCDLWFFTVKFIVPVHWCHFRI